jgi:RNA polymerase sigma factor (sigma-70 family)
MASAHLGAAMRHIRLLFGEGTLGALPDAQLLERYVAHRDEPAFNALVHRHGPMVLAVCRGVLDDPNDADDAFQATFLLFARKAGTLWVNASLGGWLHRVAWRIAFQVKSQAVRRRDQERRAAEMAGPPRSAGPPWDDTQLILHQEIDRLPERFRKPIVLCYLEGMTYQQAASHLRWSEATTQGRLARARNLLRTRLRRRGVTLAGSTLVALAGPRGVSAVSLAMLRVAVQTAYRFELGETTAVETASPIASALVTRALRNMLIAKLRWAAAASLVIGGLTCAATGLAATRHAVLDGPAATSPGGVPGSHGPFAAAGPEDAEPGPTAEGRISADAGPVPGPDGGPVPRAASSPMEGDHPRDPVNLTRDLEPRRHLERGDSLFSPLGGFRLHMRDDGNLVLSAIDDSKLPADLRSVLFHAPEVMSLYTNEIWSTGTNVPRNGAGVGAYCVMHDDGEFAVYDEAGDPCFSSHTRGKPGAFLRCQDDGNVVLYVRDPEFRSIWATKTSARTDDTGESRAD